MPRLFLFSLIIFCVFQPLQIFASDSAHIVPSKHPRYEFRQMTSVESVVPGGLGRSRLISADAQGKEEQSNLQNFFSMVGINFSNIRENDKLITKKIQELSNEGWELFSVNTGVYGSDRSTGIFITRFLFRREK